MTFPGRFADQLIPDQLHRVSLSFLVDELEIRRGGCAANIAFSMGILGGRPLLVGAVGDDFADYRAWLERHGVDTSGVHVSEVHHTPRFRVTTLGPKGAVIDRKGEEGLHVPAAPEVGKVDPTGVGDAFRAGFLSAVNWSLSLERAAQVGNLIAAYVLESAGGQEYTFERTRFLERLGGAYGQDAAAEVAPHLI